MPKFLDTVTSQFNFMRIRVGSLSIISASQKNDKQVVVQIFSPTNRMITGKVRKKGVYCKTDLTLSFRSKSRADQALKQLRAHCKSEISISRPNKQKPARHVA